LLFFVFFQKCLVCAFSETLFYIKRSRGAAAARADAKALTAL
jgi:hypothetical protein